MAVNKGLKRWLREQRTTTRLAYLLQVATRIAGSFAGLFWFRLLVGTMGKEMYNLFLAFQSLSSIGGLGDLGMGGAVAIRAGQYFGQGKERELQKFLATARSVFLMLAFIVGGGLLILSPWLPQWRQFTLVAGAGSQQLLLVVGACSIAAVILSSYISNLNYACGNVTWPTVPLFILGQFALVTHWALARQHQPLWIQCLPYLAISVIGMCLLRYYVRISHPPLAGLLPLSFDRRTAVSLFENSFWVYLCSLGNAIYRNTDTWVITLGFPLGLLDDYIANYKFCELTVFVVSMASFVSLPKTTQWLASSVPADQERVRREIKRLNQFQTLLGCGAALAYLACNDLFIKLWWFHAKDPVRPAVLVLQIAFALNLAVTASGDAGLQLSLRSGNRGMRLIGMVVALTGLLNLGLSLVAMKMGSLWGIAMATVLAQSGSTLGASYHICRQLKIPWLAWATKTWLFPVVGISIAGWLRMIWPMDSVAHVFLLLGSYAGLLVFAAWGLGVNLNFIKDELQIVKQFIHK